MNIEIVVFDEHNQFLLNFKGSYRSRIEINKKEKTNRSILELMVDNTQENVISLLKDCISDNRKIKLKLKDNKVFVGHLYDSPEQVNETLLKFIIIEQM